MLNPVAGKGSFGLEEWKVNSDVMPTGNKLAVTSNRLPGTNLFTIFDWTLGYVTVNTPYDW